MLNGLDKIEGLTPEQLEAINKLAGGLISKKTELEEKLSKTKTVANENQSAVEKLAALEANLEREQLESKENYQGALSLKEKEFNAQLEKLTIGLGEKESLIHKLLVDNGLAAELVALGVNKDLMPLIQQGFSAKATIVDGQAMIDDKSLSDYMKEWAETPQGKASRTAPANNGGDGNGGGGLPQAKQMKDMNGAERTALLNSNPEEFNRLKAEMLAQKK